MKNLKDLKKIEKLPKTGCITHTIGNQNVVSKLNKRVISAHLIDKKGGTKLEFKIKTPHAGSPSVFHTTENKGKVKVSTIYLSMQAIEALHLTLGKYIDAVSNIEVVTKVEGSDNDIDEPKRSEVIL